MKICPVGAKLFHADIRSDGQTDVMKLVVAFQNFYKTPEKLSFILFWGGGRCKLHVIENCPGSQTYFRGRFLVRGLLVARLCLT